MGKINNLKEKETVKNMRLHSVPIRDQNVSCRCTNTSKIIFVPKGVRFCEDNLLKLLIGSQPIIEDMSLICGGRG